MNKIINFKKYDTDTAQKIASVSSGGSYTDFGYSEETLYRKMEEAAEADDRVSASVQHEFKIHLGKDQDRKERKDLEANRQKAKG